MTKNKAKRGFTIVELVIVVAVIGILSAILIPTFVNLVDTSNKAARSADLLNAYKMYQMDAVDGYAGDEDSLDSSTKSEYEIKNIKQDLIYLSTEKNEILAKENAYHFVDKKWVKGTPNKLLSVCTGYDYHAAKYGNYYAFYEQARLEEIDINPSPTGGLSLRVGMAVDLVAQPQPKNAIVEHPVWSSNNDSVTVSEDGTVRGEANGSATITVFDDTNENGTKDENEIASTVQVEISGTISPSEVVAIEAPAAVADYDANTAHLDSISGIAVSRARAANKLPSPSMSRSTYFANKNNTRDTYKVGYRNAFKFDYVANLDLASDSLKEIGAYAVAPYEPTIKKWDTGTGAWVAVSDNSAIIDDNLVKFTSAANEQKYQLSVSGNNCSYSFEFEVFDGWNIYSAKELALFDNRNTTAGRFYFADANQRTHKNSADQTVYEIPAIDYWRDYRVDAFGTDVSDEVVNGIALHTDIKITNSLIPSELKYSAEEVDAYINNPNNANDYADWLQKIKDEYQTYYGSDYKLSFDGRTELIGSLKDDLAVFERVTNGETFNFEGNYFQIDASGIKNVYAYQTYGNNSNDPIRDGTLYSYKDEDGGVHVRKTECHAGLFGFNLCNTFAIDSNHPITELARFGINNFNNFTIIGNAPLDNNPKSGGGLAAIKATSTTINTTNVIFNKNYINIQGGVNWTIWNETDSNGFVFNPEICYITEGDNQGFHGGDVNEAPNLVLRADRCKGFNSFNVMFYLMGCNDNVFSNCWFQDAGGPLFILDELNYANYDGYRTRENPSITDYRYHNGASAEAINTYLENWVQGTEPWFEINGAQKIAQTIVPLGVSGGWLYENAQNFENGKQPVKIENNKSFINLLALDFTSSSILANKGRALEGHFTIKDSEDSVVYSMDLTKLSNPNSPLSQYNALFTALDNAGQADQAIFYETSANGHGAFLSFTGITLSQSGFAPYADSPQYQGTAAMINSLMPCMYTGGTIYDVNETFAQNLASGDYASIYMKPSSGAHYVALLLGLN